MYWFSPVSRVKRMFGGYDLVGPSGVNVVRHPIHAEAYHWSPHSGDTNWLEEDPWNYAKYSRVAPLLPEEAKRISEILLDSSSYSWGTRKSCIPRDGVRVHFQVEKESVDMLICFECNLLVVNHDGTEVSANFDRAPALMREIRELFPNDPAIADLRESN